MANKKKGGKKPKPNTALAKTNNRPAANKAPKPNPVQSKGKGSGRKPKHNGWLPNISLSQGRIGGVSLWDAGGAGLGLLTGEGGAALLPQSYIGDVLLLVGGIAVSAALANFRFTKPIANGFGIGVGAVAVKNGLNRATNGAVSNFFTGAAQRVGGYLQPPPPSQNNGQGQGGTGVGGFGPYVRTAQVW